MITKKRIIKLTKAQKAISGIISLFLGIVTIITLYKSYTTKDINGEWYMEFKVEKSAYKPFIGETHTQKVILSQDDNKVDGNGEKWEYNGVYLPADMHRRVEYSGIIKGDEFTAKYILYGLKRTSIGRIVVKIVDDTMEGTFSGTAGESSGKVTGKKLN